MGSCGQKRMPDKVTRLTNGRWKWANLSPIMEEREHFPQNRVAQIWAVPRGDGYLIRLEYGKYWWTMFFLGSIHLFSQTHPADHPDECSETLRFTSCGIIARAAVKILEGWPGGSSKHVQRWQRSKTPKLGRMHGIWCLLSLREIFGVHPSHTSCNLIAESGAHILRRRR